MTVSVNTATSGPYYGNGVTTLFSRTFPIGDEDNVTVELDDVVQTSGYTVLKPTSDTGNIEFDTAPADGVKIYIYRTTIPAQNTDYSAQGVVSPEQVERDFDYLMELSQELKRDVDRSVKSALGVDGRSIEAFADGRYILTDSDGNLVDGGPASDIQNAQQAALDAEAAQAAAEAAATTAAGIVISGVGQAEPPRFSTVQMLIDDVADTYLVNLSIGNVIATAGYHAPEDGGGNFYKVVAGSTGTVDGGSFIDLPDGTQLQGMFPDGVINPMQFGAYGDDTDHLMSADFADQTAINAFYPFAATLLNSDSSTHITTTTTRDTAAIQAMLHYQRTNVNEANGKDLPDAQEQAQIGEMNLLDKQYVVNRPLDMTNFRTGHTPTRFVGNGAVIRAKCWGFIVLDCTRSRRIMFDGWKIIGDQDPVTASNICKVGLLFARNADAQPADSHQFRGLTIDGKFSLANHVNLASENVAYGNRALFTKNSLGVDGGDPAGDYNSKSYCMFFDAANLADVTSDFDTKKANTSASFLGNAGSWDARHSGTGDGCFMHETTSFDFYGAYCVATDNDASCVTLYFTQNAGNVRLRLPTHFETDLGDSDLLTGVGHLVTIDATSGGGITPFISQMVLHDNKANAGVVFEATSDVSLVVFRDANIFINSDGNNTGNVLFNDASKFRAEGGSLVILSTSATLSNVSGMDTTGNRTWAYMHLANVEDAIIGSEVGPVSIAGRNYYSNGIDVLTEDNAAFSVWKENGGSVSITGSWQYVDASNEWQMRINNVAYHEWGTTYYQPTTDDLINLGSSSKRFKNLFLSGDDVRMDGLPTSAPATSGRLWNDSGTVKIVP